MLYCLANLKIFYKLIYPFMLCTVQVPGNLVISARSAAHSFDASQMNMSHVISSFSFGKTITPKVMSDIKRLLPHLGRSHDRLNGNSYVTNPRDSTENVTVSFLLAYYIPPFFLDK